MVVKKAGGPVKQLYSELQSAGGGATTCGFVDLVAGNEGQIWLLVASSWTEAAGWEAGFTCLEVSLILTMKAE